MITNAIINFVLGFFDWIFELLPIPEMPDWLEFVVPRLCGYIHEGVKMFSWLFPLSLYSYVIDTCLACLVVRVSYDVYKKFHRLRSS